MYRQAVLMERQLTTTRKTVFLFSFFSHSRPRQILKTYYMPQISCISFSKSNTFLHLTLLFDVFESIVSPSFNAVFSPTASKNLSPWDGMSKTSFIPPTLRLGDSHTAFQRALKFYFLVSSL